MTANSHRLLRFRLRLITAFGVGMLPGLCFAPLVSAEEQSTQCFPIAQGQTCPGIDEALVAIDEEHGVPYCEERTVLEEVEGELGTCCYTVVSHCEEIDDELDCGCYGRPYVSPDEGVISAPTVDNLAWGPALEASGEADSWTADERAALIAFWSDNARAEHSSIAGFARLALELMAHGAPPELIERSLRAAGDELRHAQLCYALASRFAGRALGPGALPLGARAPIATSLVELAVATAREGCLGETSAAWLASEMAARASDPEVRAALESIADDEAEHAELAWMTLRWAIEAGGPEVAKAVAEVFRAARPAQAHGGALAVPSHGLLAASEVQAIVDLGFAEVLVPVMRLAS